jgi:hypothetical protein
MVARVDPEMIPQLNGDPNCELEAIVTVTESLDDLIASLPDGVVVQQRYRLIKGVAVTGSARALRLVAALPMVKTIEPVRSVQAY